MFLSNSLNSYCLFPIRWINRYWQIIYCEVHVTLRWTSSPSELGGGGGGEGGSRNTPSLYMLQKPE